MGKHRLRLPYGLMLALAPAAILPGSARAQEATIPTLAGQCQADAQVVSTHQPDSLYHDAVLSMADCDVTGPPALVTLWNSSTTDTATISLLTAATGHLRDARLLSALTTLVRNASASNTRRLAAMQVLVSYFHPGRAVSGADLLAPDSTKGLYMVMDFATISGSQPFLATYRNSIAESMKFVAASTGNEVMRKAAALVREELYWVAPASTPLTSEAVTVVYNCGNRFKIRNADNIPLILRYKVGDTADTGRVDIKSRPAGASYREIFLTTKLKGTLKVYHLNTLLRTAANGGTTCE